MGRGRRSLRKDDIHYSIMDHWGLHRYAPGTLLSALQQTVALNSDLEGLVAYNYLPADLPKSVCVFVGLLLQYQQDADFYRRLTGLFLTHSTACLQQFTDFYYQQPAAFPEALKQRLKIVEAELKKLAEAGIRGSSLSQQLLNYPNGMETWELTGLATLFGVTLALYEGEGRLKVVLPLGVETQQGTLALLVMGKQTFWMEFAPHPASNLALIIAKLVSDCSEMEIKRKSASFNDYQYAQLRILSVRIAENANLLLNRPELCDFQQILIHQLTKSYKDAPISCAFPLGVLLECGHWTSVHSEPPSFAYPHVCDVCNEKIKRYIDLERVLLPSELEALQQQGLCSSCLQVSGNTYKGSCGHAVCYPCVYVAFIEMKPICKICSVYARNRNFLRNLKPIQCVMCREMHSLTEFPPIHYDQNLVCYDCYNSPLASPLNAIPLKPEEQKYVQKVFFTCRLCTKQQNRKQQYKDSQCCCEVCVSCMDDRMVERENWAECAECKVQVSRQGREAVRGRVEPRIEERRKQREAEKRAKEQQEKAEKERVERAAEERKQQAEKEQVERAAEERKQQAEKERLDQERAEEAAKAVVAEEQRPPAEGNVLPEPEKVAEVPIPA